MMFMQFIGLFFFCTILASCWDDPENEIPDKTNKCVQESPINKPVTRECRNI